MIAEHAGERRTLLELRRIADEARTGLGARLMQTLPRMSEKHEGEALGELPLDFTQFLSSRLGMEASAALSILGSYLLNFEPAGRYPRLDAGSRPPLCHAISPI